MKKLVAGPLLLIIALFIIPGCYNDNEYDLYPFSAGCDSSNVTYAQTIAPIMEFSCNKCHSTIVASGNVVTDSYEGLSTVAKNGKLWGGVNAEPGFVPMPNEGSKLSSCDLGKIKKWINAGSPNN
jgi:hypothetical protein